MQDNSKKYLSQKIGYPLHIWPLNQRQMVINENILKILELKFPGYTRLTACFLSNFLLFLLSHFNRK